MAQEKQYFTYDPITEEVVDYNYYDDQPANSTVIPPTKTFIKMKFSVANQEYYEGASIEEVSSVKTPEYMKKLQDIVVDLMSRAEKAAIDKTGTSDYIKVQVDLYKNKYLVALGEISNPVIEAYITNEAQEFGVDYEAFCELIIWMYETSLGLFQNFQYMIERCRTKIQTLIENMSWSQADDAFALVSTLNNVDQAEALMDQILAL